MSIAPPRKSKAGPVATERGHDALARAAAPARVKIVDVAREAGVSPTTVSHALNDRGQVDPKTRAAVKQIALRLGYRPNRHAQSLRTGQAHMIALVSSMPFAVAGGPSRLGFLMEIAAAAASAALTRGLALVLVPPTEGGVLSIGSLDIDGALVVEPAATDAHVTHLLERGLPVVTIGRQAGRPVGRKAARQAGRPAGGSPGTLPALPCVDLNVAHTTTLLLDHLRDQGGRRIALLIGSQQRTSYTEAVGAYEAFALRHRMTSMLQPADENHGEDAGHEATLELMARYPRIDALCAPVDAFAVGALRALKELGKRVPQDVMVATRYDGLRARNATPALTSLNLHLDSVATQAIELLFDHLGGRTGERERQGPPADLVPRESTRRRPV